MKNFSRISWKYLQFILLLAIVLFNFSPISTGVAHAIVCYTLTLAANPAAGGNITPTPAPNCGSQYTEGTNVQLQADLNANYIFAGWSGAATASTNPITVTMNANKSVTAKFFADRWQEATAITLPFSISGDTTTAAVDAVNVPDPDPCFSTGNPSQRHLKNGLASVWFKYTPTANETVSFDSLGSTTNVTIPPPNTDPSKKYPYDTYIAVWSGTIDKDPLTVTTLVGCNDDNDAGNQSQLGIPVQAGVTYYIQVGQYNGFLGEIPEDQGYIGGNLQFRAELGSSIDVSIGGILKGSYDLLPNQGQVVKYPVDGAVVITNTSGAGFVASLNQWRRYNTGVNEWTGVTQSLALPLAKVSNIYVMPRYDYTDTARLYNAVLLANVDTVSRDITVTIGGTVMGTYTLAPSESQYKTYPGVAGGPLVVSSVTGAKIVASLYELKKDPGTSGWIGQSEMMGLPWEETSDAYLIPIYFGDPSHPGLKASLYIANVDTVARDITVKIGGVVKGTYTLQKNTGQVLTYPVDGAVEISSASGAKIVASLNQWRRYNTAVNEWTGVTQTMALPLAKVSNIYVMPRYDYADSARLYDAVLIANVDTVSRAITVTIGGVVKGTYTLAPSESQYKTYPGVAGGPLVVSSVTGAKIVASLYELKKDPGTSGWIDQSEMMGLPWESLSDTYLIPIYFGDPSHPGLNASLFIGVP